MRVRRSAIGSVMLIKVLQWYQLLPAGQPEARNFAAHGCFAQLGTTQTELAVVTAWTARDLTAVPQARLARIARQCLKLRNRSLAFRRRTCRLADDLFQLRASCGVAFYQLRSLLFAIDHRCLGHSPYRPT